LIKWLARTAAIMVVEYAAKQAMEKRK